jgi:phosphoglycerate dehydrogenase-like enzyme
MRVLSQVRGALSEQAAAQLPGIEFVEVLAEGEPPAGVSGEVLWTLPWGTPNLAAVLARGVRWVHTIGTGIDRFPIELVGDRILTCSRGASAVPIAEWVMAVLLAFEKRLPATWINEPGQWQITALGGLHGRTLGLIGLGGIGTAVAQRALPFGARVRAFRRTGRPSPVPGVEVVSSLVEVLRDADHVVVAAAATPATRHLLDRDAFAVIKPGAHVVNVARGALIDQEALRAALDDGRVAMASLDAVDPEPPPEGHWLYTHPGVRLSPHISWSMPGAIELLIGTFVDNLRRYRAGQPLTGVVDVAAGY